MFKKFQQSFVSPLGFTLIELMVIIAIIGVLATVVLLAIDPNEIMKKSRDAARASGVKYLQNALEVYFVTYQKYPYPIQVQFASYAYENIKQPGAGHIVEQALIDSGALGGTMMKKPIATSYTGSWWYPKADYWQYVVWNKLAGQGWVNSTGCSFEKNYRILVELESWSSAEINSLPGRGMGCKYLHSCYWDANNIAICYLFPGQQMPTKSEIQ